MLKKVLWAAFIVFMIIGGLEASEDVSMYRDALMYRKNDQPEMAFLKFQHIAQFYPDSKYADEAQFRVAEFYFEKGDYFNAELELKAHLEKFPYSRFNKQTKAYLDGMMAIKLVKQADASTKKQNYNSALEAYRQAYKIDPKIDNLAQKLEEAKEERAQELVREAGIFSGKQDWHRALGAYIQALELDPSLASSLKERISQCNSKVSHDQDQGSQGLVKYGDKWVSPEQKQILQLSQEGDSFFSQQDWGKALEVYLEVLKLDPKARGLKEKIVHSRKMFEFEEERKAEGLIKYGKKWNTPQEKEAIEEEKELERRQKGMVHYQKAKEYCRQADEYLFVTAKTVKIYKNAITQAQYSMEYFKIDEAEYQEMEDLMLKAREAVEGYEQRMSNYHHRRSQGN